MDDTSQINNLKIQIISAERAKDFAKDFIAEFHARFGVFPSVKFSISTGSYPRVLLSQLEALVNYLISKDDEVPEEVKTLKGKSKIRKLVLYRHCFYKIAYDMHYNLKAIGQQVGFDHSTVLYGRNNVVNLINIKDEQTIAVLHSIQEELKLTYGNKEDIQYNIEV